MQGVAYWLTAASLGGCLLATTAEAGPIVITFDKPPCAPVERDVYPANCYADSGVILSATGNRGTAPVIRFTPSQLAVSRPNVATGQVVWGGIPNLSDVRMDFVAASGAIGFTDFVSWHVTGSPQGDPWGAWIVGVAGVLEQRLGFGGQLVTFSRPQRDIAAAAWFSGTGPPPIGVDNLAFNAPQAAAPAVPEPSTILLLGAGAAMLARRRRTRARPHGANT